MTDEQFTAFSILLAAVSLPSVSLLFAGAWELWRYTKRAGNERCARNNHRGRGGLDYLVASFRRRLIR
jgi:hypothetical protein